MIQNQNIHCKENYIREKMKEQSVKWIKALICLLQLTNRYSNSGRTIVADNFFTTWESSKRLANLGLAYVGIIRSNEIFLPEEMRKNASRPVLSSLFGFHESLVSICSYVPKKIKQWIYFLQYTIQNVVKANQWNQKQLIFITQIRVASTPWTKWLPIWQQNGQLDDGPMLFLQHIRCYD